MFEEGDVGYNSPKIQVGERKVQAVKGYFQDREPVNYLRGNQANMLGFTRMRSTESPELS